LDAARKPPPNPTEVIVVDEDMAIDSDADQTILQNKLPADPSVLNNRKRVATENQKEIDNVDMVDKVAQTSADNDDERKPMPPMQTHSYNAYVTRRECVSFVDRPARKLFPSHTQLFNLIVNCLDQSDIALFLMISNLIRSYSQTCNDFVVAFNEEGPSFIHPDILKIFGNKKIGKTPAWTIAHCLECLPSTKK